MAGEDTTGRLARLADRAGRQAEEATRRVGEVETLLHQLAADVASLARLLAPDPDLSEKRRVARAQRSGTVRWPQPRQKPNGRWLAKCIEAGHLHTRTFDTRAEAEQFIREIKGAQ